MPAQPSHPNQPQSPDKQSSMTGSGWGSKKRGGTQLTEQRPNTGFTTLYGGENLRHHHPIPISSAAPILNVDLHARLTLVQWLEGQWLGHHGIWSQLAILDTLDTLPTPAKKGKVFQLDSHPYRVPQLVALAQHGPGCISCSRPGCPWKRWQTLVVLRATMACSHGSQHKPQWGTVAPQLLCL